MILFFNLDVGKKLADCTVAKDEYITVIFRGCELFTGDTVRCKKGIVFLVLRLPELAVGSFWVVVSAITVIAVAAWHGSGQNLLQTVVVLLFIPFQRGK